MSFRIDLTFKNNVHVYLVVVRDQINVHFMAADSAEPYADFKLRSNFQHLLTHFSLEHHSMYVKGKEGAHIKRHHVYFEETKIPHVHSSFKKNVNPEILKKYLTGILEAQEDHDEEYEFLNASFIADILETFGEYYQNFSGSKLEQEYLDERQLTLEEKKSIAEEKTRGTLSSRDKEELNKCGIAIPKSPPQSPREEPKIPNLMRNFLRLLFSQSSPTVDDITPSSHNSNNY